MKKNILLGLLSLILLFCLTGCDKSKEKPLPLAPISSTKENSNIEVVEKNPISTEDVEIKKETPLEGADETTETINEIDQIISSDASLDENSLSDSELGL